MHIAPESKTADHVEQSVVYVDQKHKPAALAHYLKELPIERAIVFTRTKHGADKVVKKLREAEVTGAAIHGNKSQNARARTLDAFRKGKVHVLVATDVASRGIDIDGVSHVINYDLTHEPESYVHRIGRTARAGASGVAISFCARDEKGHLKGIERLLKTRLEPRTDLPDDLAAAAPDPGDSAEPAGPGSGNTRRPTRPRQSKGQGQGHRKGPPRGKRQSGGKGRGKPRRSAV